MHTRYSQIIPVNSLALVQGAAIITGLGFTGYNEEGKTLWDGAANIRVLNIEFAENFKMLLDSWNMKTNVWLRECIYKRVTKKGAKPGFKSSMMTFTVSAIWVRFFFIDGSQLLVDIAFLARRFSGLLSHVRFWRLYHHRRSTGPFKCSPIANPRPRPTSNPSLIQQKALRLVRGRSDRHAHELRRGPVHVTHHRG